MRPHSTLGILRHNSTNSSSSEDGNQQPPWLQSQDWDRHHSTTSEDLYVYSSTFICHNYTRGSHGRDHMVVGLLSTYQSVPITNDVSSNLGSGRGVLYATLCDKLCQ